VCPDLDAKPEALTWFADHKSMTAPVVLAKEVPEGGVRMELPSLEDLVELRDWPFTHREILRELALRLPQDFPDFDGGGDHRVYEFITPRPLSAGEERLARRAFASLGYGDWFEFRPVVRADLAWQARRYRDPRRDGDMELIPARWLPAELSAAARGLVERDDECWMQQRRALFRGEITSPTEFLPPALRTPSLRALVNASGLPPEAIGGLFAIFDVVCLVLPLAIHEEPTFAAMGVSLTQWIDLAREGRAVILLPQSLDRYAASTINRLCGDVPDALCMSRALGAATIVALQRQLGPLLFPTIHVEERHRRLRTTERRRAAGRVPFSKLPLHVTLRRNWASGEWLAHVYGAMAHAYTGFGEMLSHMFMEAGKPDRHLEFTSAWNTVAWSSATDAVMVPSGQDGYSEYSFLEVLLKTVAAMGASFSVNVSGATSLTLPEDFEAALQLGRRTQERPLREHLRTGDLSGAMSEAVGWKETVLDGISAEQLDTWCIEATSRIARAAGEGNDAGVGFLRSWLAGSDLRVIEALEHLGRHGQSWRLCSRHPALVHPSSG
jgi:hypothetical protein